MITVYGLKQLGFKPSVDFQLYDNRDGNGVQIEWFSNEPQPSESDIEAAQVVWTAEQSARPARLASVKSKLEALGLTAEEVQEAFGL